MSRPPSSGDLDVYPVITAPSGYTLNCEEPGSAATMRKALTSWVGHARRAGGRKQSGTRAAVAKRSDLNEIGARGRANGYKVSDRGRVSVDVVKAYDAAR